MVNVLLVDLGTPRNEISETLGIETLASYVEEDFKRRISLDVRSLELDGYSEIKPYLKRKNIPLLGFPQKYVLMNSSGQVWNRLEKKPLIATY